MTINKGTLLLNALFSVLVIVAGISHCGVKCNREKHSGLNQQTQQFKLDKDSIVKQYVTQLERINGIQDSLQKELAQTKVKLVSYQKQALIARTGISQRINKKSIDTSEILADCDSLKAEVEGYIELVAQQDSVQQKAIIELEQLNLGKDSAYQECQQSFDAMTSLADESIKVQDELSQNLIATQDKLERSRLLTQVLSITAATLTGALLLISLK